jgi:hypothetical protein
MGHVVADQRRRHGSRVSSLSTASSIPQTHAPEHKGGAAVVPQTTTQRGGEAAPSELTLALMNAHRAWAERDCPWTLEEWING